MTKTKPRTKPDVRIGNVLYIRRVNRVQTKRLNALAKARGMTIRDFLGVGNDHTVGLLPLYEFVLAEAKRGTAEYKEMLEGFGIGPVDV